MSASPLKILCVVLTYWVISITMVFANKYLVGTQESELDLSLFVAWIQCLVTVGFVFSLNFFKGAIKKDFSAIKLRMSNCYMPQIMLMTCSYVSMLTFNNLCLKHVGVAFYQVARSMTLIFTVILSVLVLKKKVSWKVLACCVTVAAGFVLGSDQESLAGTFSLKGMVFGVISSLFIALNGIFTKRALDAVDHDSVKLTLYNNINACVLFIPFVVGTKQLQSVLLTPSVFQDVFFWTFLLSSGVLAFLIAWISAVQIDLTSPITHHISANSKAVVQTALAVVYYQEYKSVLWWCSILLVVGGALSYALVRAREDHKEKQKSSKLSGQSKLAGSEKQMNGVLKSVP